MELFLFASMWEMQAEMLDDVFVSMQEEGYSKAYHSTFLVTMRAGCLTTSSTCKKAQSITLKDLAKRMQRKLHTVGRIGCKFRSKP